MMQCAPFLDSAVARGGDFPLQLCSPTADTMRQLLRGALALAGEGSKLYVASDTHLDKLGEVVRFYTQNDGFYTCNDGFYTQNDGFYTCNDELYLERCDFTPKTMDVRGKFFESSAR